MIDRHRVINEFEKLYDSGQNEACLMPQCEAVCLAVEAKLRRAAYAGREEIILFAAALLNRRLTGKTADEDAVASFRAGDVTVSRRTGEKLANAEKETQRAFELAAPLLRDDGFLFIRC